MTMSPEARAILEAKLALERELARPLDQVCMAYIRARQSNGNQPLGVYDRLQHLARLERLLLRHYCRVSMVMTGRRPRLNPEPHEAALSLRHMESMRSRAKRQAGLIVDSMDRGFASEAPSAKPDLHDDGTSLFKADKPKPVGWIGKFRAKIPTIANVQTNGPAEEARMEIVPDDQANGKIVKVWHNVGDDRVRGAPHNPRPSRFDHWEPEGQERLVTDAFDISGERMQMPGDTALGASLGNVINCFPGDTRVSGRITAATRHWYEGDLVEITTAGGHNLAGTPNHPVLTPEGWVALGALHKGSHVVCRSVGRVDTHVLGDSTELPGERTHDVDDIEPSIEQVFDALARRSVTVGVPGLAVDFHGDAPTSEVEIVRTDRELKIGLDAAISEHGLEFGLATAHLAERGGFINGTSGQFIGPDLAPTHSAVCGGGEAFPFLGGHAGVTLQHSFAPVARANAEIMKAFHDSGAIGSVLGGERFDGRARVEVGGNPTADLGPLAAGLYGERLTNRTNDTPAIESPEDGGRRTPDMRGDLWNRHPALVETHEVVDLVIRKVACHVYNLESQRDSHYSANSIIAHNCRCYVSFQFLGDDGTRTPIYTTPSAPARRQKRPNETLETAKPRLNPTSQITLNGGTRANLVLHDSGKTIAQMRQLKPNLIEVRVNGKVIARAETNPEAGTITKITVAPKYRSNGSDVEGIIRRSVAGSAEHLARVRNRTP